MSITTLARKRAIAPRPPRTLRAVAAFAVALALVPLAYLIHRGIDAGLGRMGEVLLRADIGSLILRSVGLAALVGLTSAIIGSFTAWVCECSDLRAASMWHVLTVAPLAVPSYVAAYAWISISGSFASFWGATLVLTGVCIPLVHLHVTSALRRLDPALEDVAMSLGWPPAKVALRLVMPQVKRAVASGALLAFLYTLADFGVVATMRLQVFTWVIHGAYKASFDPNRAAILALVVCGISVVFVMLELGVRGDGSSSRVGAGVARERMRYPLGKTRVPVILALVTIVSLALGMPVVRSAQWVLAGGSEVTIEEFTRALITTLALGAAVALATIIVAVPLAWLAAKHATPSTVFAERSVLVMHSLPGIVVAIAFVYLGTRALMPIYQRWPIVVLGMTALMLSLAVGTLRTAFEQQSSGLTRAAQSSGTSELRALMTVHVPLARAAILAAIASVAIHTAKELPMTLLLRPSGAETMTTRVWKWAAVSDDASVGPYALALIALSVPPTMLLAYRERRSAHRSPTEKVSLP